MGKVYMKTITTEVILSRRKGLYNQVILYYVLPYVQQNEPRQKQIGSTCENLCYMDVQKVSQLRLK